MTAKEVSLCRKLGLPTRSIFWSKSNEIPYRFTYTTPEGTLLHYTVTSCGNQTCKIESTDDEKTGFLQRHPQELERDASVEYDPCLSLDGQAFDFENEIRGAQIEAIKVVFDIVRSAKNRAGPAFVIDCILSIFDDNTMSRINDSQLARVHHVSRSAISQCKDSIRKQLGGIYLGSSKSHQQRKVCSNKRKWKTLQESSSVKL